MFGCKKLYYKSARVVDIDVLFGAVEGEGMMVKVGWAGWGGLKAEPPLAADSIGNLDGLNAERLPLPLTLNFETETP